MKTYKLISGETLAANSSAGLIDQLREATSAWQPTRSVAEFLEGMARMSELQTGKKVRTDSADDFVADLISCGMLEEI